jgi:SET domain-containing protein
MKIVVQVSAATSLENSSVIESSCLISVCYWGFEHVFWTRKRGWGVRTMEPILPGQLLFEFVGEICTNAKMIQRNNSMKSSISYSLQLDADWQKEVISSDSDALCIDDAHFSNILHFLNHKCEGAKLLDMHVRINEKNPHYYHVAFFAKRAINALEELTWVLLVPSYSSSIPFYFREHKNLVKN